MTQRRGCAAAGTRLPTKVGYDHEGSNRFATSPQSRAGYGISAMCGQLRYMHATEEFDRQLKNGLVKDKDYDGFVLGYLMNSCLPDR